MQIWPVHVKWSSRYCEIGLETTEATFSRFSYFLSDKGRHFVNFRVIKTDDSNI